MRLFVFGTGRCGTVSMARALRYADNFTVGHETKCPDLCYPDQHIEVNPQLRVVVHQLVQLYPDAMYCLLTRDMVKVARSYARLRDGDWLHYWWGLNTTVRPADNDDAAMIAVADLVRQCHTAWFRCPENHRMLMDIDHIKEPFKKLWKRIGATGNLAEALVSFDYPLNTSEQRGN